MPPCLPLQRKLRGWGYGRFSFRDCGLAQEGFPVSQEQTPARPQNAGIARLPSVLYPLGGCRRPGGSRFLTLFSSCKWKLSFWQHGRKPTSLDCRVNKVWMRPGGGLGLAGRRRRAGWAVQLAAALRPSYLLLNFSGCFSLITWNLWAMEAS